MSLSGPSVRLVEKKAWHFVGKVINFSFSFALSSGSDFAFVWRQTPPIGPDAMDWLNPVLLNTKIIKFTIISFNEYFVIIMSKTAKFPPKLFWRWCEWFCFSPKFPVLRYSEAVIRSTVRHIRHGVDRECSCATQFFTEKWAVCMFGREYATRCNMFQKWQN